MSKTKNSIFESLKNGETVPGNHPERSELRKAAFATIKLLQELNNSFDPTEINEILRKITDTEVDESVAVFPPFYINYGKNLKIGKNVFINFDCTFLDLGGITIEDDVLIGPKVSLVTENHPLNPQERKGMICKPILIKKNAWIGANATILPGVTIGENAVVAAGAVFAKDVSDNTIVGGVPAKFIKTIEH